MNDFIKKVVDNNFFLLKLLVIIFPWSNALTNVIIGAIILVGTIKIVKQKKKIENNKIIPLLLLGIFVFSFFVHSLFSNSFEDDTNYLARILVLFFLPLSIYFVNEKKRVEPLLKIFLHSVTLLCAATMVLATKNFVSNGYGGTWESFFTYTNLSSTLVNHQAIYFALYVGMACVISFRILLDLKRSKTKKLLIIELLFLFFFLFLLGARTALVSTLICLAIVALLHSRTVFYKLLIISSLLLCSNYFLNNSFRTRVNHVISFSTDFDYSNDWSYEGLAFRFMTWNCSREVIKENFWTGAGIGKTQDLLDKCYKEKSYQSLLFFIEKNGEKFNSHNLFLNVFATNGIVGFILLTLIFGYFLYVGYKDYNGYLLLFLIFFLLNGMTESLFIREKGIQFFAIFISILLNGERLKSLNEYT